MTGRPKLTLAGCLLLFLITSGCDALTPTTTPVTTVDSTVFEERINKLEEEVTSLSDSISELAAKVDSLPVDEVRRLDQMQTGLSFSTAALLVLEEATDLAAQSSDELSQYYNDNLDISQLRTVLLDRQQRITGLIGEQENIFVPEFAIDKKSNLIELFEMVRTHLEFLENLSRNGANLTLREKAQISALPSEYEKRAYDWAVEIRRELLDLKLLTEHEIKSIESSR
jgi:hypothetical protein